MDKLTNIQLLKSCNKQRFKVLKYAFKILDCFAYPSLSPDQFNNYEQIKNILLKRYK